VRNFDIPSFYCYKIRFIRYTCFPGVDSAALNSEADHEAGGGIGLLLDLFAGALFLDACYFLVRVRCL